MTERPYWIGAGVILFGALWVYQSFANLPQLAQYAELGPGFTVSLIGAGLIVLGLILVWQIRRGESFEPQEGEDVDARQTASWPALGLAVAGASLPLLTMQHLGFAITAACSFILVTRALGSRRLILDAVIGLVLGLVCWYGFGTLGVPLGGLVPFLGV